MSKNDKLKKAYRDLQLQEAPDLWERIEGGLKTEETRHENQRAAVFANGRKRQRMYQIGAGLAAACCLLFVAGSLFTGREGAADMAAAGTTAWSAAEAGTEAAAETAAEAHKEAVPADTAEKMPKEAGVPYETAAMPEYEDHAEISDLTGLPGIIRYESLALAGTVVPVPDSEAVYEPADSYYFTEDSLREASLLSQAEVTEISYEKDSAGRIQNVVYEMNVDRVLYSEDYVSEGQSIRVKSPLVGSTAENSMLYELKEGGTYILPLKAEGTEWWLAFPYAPQIEVTEDTRYLFHNGWKSLVDDRTSVVVMTAKKQGDCYYDRMVLRDDSEFLSNLAELTEAKRKEGEKRL
ncbi:hypothetical protein [Clostridium sp. AM58-1XD]|uniref:hypothetical protein n=1 Tax=Clostridium sp. AM58-1XD TaxID=2292307 RepID=UPI000E4B64BA|nr:hypothetical protein [Clostridium sp. AM58-1XD]RGY96840.1 hypothetical protein DXA13_16235 [Clostridium sp. AM58-1XD]